MIRIVRAKCGENKTFVLITYCFYLPLEPFAQLHYIFLFGSGTICKLTQSSLYKVGCSERVRKQFTPPAVMNQRYFIGSRVCGHQANVSSIFTLF